MEARGHGPEFPMIKGVAAAGVREAFGVPWGFTGHHSTGFTSRTLELFVAT